MVEVNTLEEVKASPGLFAEMSAMDHEEVVFCQDKATGLKAVIAVHNTVLGPSLGGTRIWNYASEAEAITDVLRLSRGMTFKNAISGLNLGGGKAVILGDARKIKSEALMRRFGRFVDSLGGRYITAEDMNMSTRDIEYCSLETKHVAGMPQERGGSGDPSPVTAYTTLMGMKAAAKKTYGNDSLAGKKVLVQGVGQVGYYLVGYLMKEGAEVTISDINDEKIKRVADEHSVTVVKGDVVYDLDMDVYAPCAMGATLNDDTIGRMKFQIVAGAANNQLAEEKRHGEMLREKGILYAPDFLINAGGVINISTEVMGNYNRDIAMRHAETVYDTTLNLFDKAETEGITNQEAAMKMAQERIEAIANVKRAY